MSGRTPRQESLFSSSAAWQWWSAGYARGVESGYSRGYLDGLQVLDEAGAFLASLEPSRTLAVRQARDEAAARPVEPLDRRAVAESWGLST